MEILEHVYYKNKEYENLTNNKSALNEYPDMSMIIKSIKQGKVYYLGKEYNLGSLENPDFTLSQYNVEYPTAQINGLLYVTRGLVLEYLKTGDLEYARIFKTLVEKWISQYPIDQIMKENWSIDRLYKERHDNALLLTYRLGRQAWDGWWSHACLLKESGIFDRTFLDTMYESTIIQLELLKKNIESHVANFRIYAYECMLYNGLTLPGLEKWIHYAIMALNSDAMLQVKEDGTYEEPTFSYHINILETFLSLYMLQIKKPELGLRLDETKLIKMKDYVMANMLPGNKIVGLNDSFGDKPNISSERMESINSRIRYLLDYYNKKHPENIIKENLKKIDYFPDAGHFFFDNTDIGKDTWFTFDAGRYAGWHSHRSALSVNMFHNGCRLLADNGIYSYERNDVFCWYGRSTAAHNTITIDNLCQNEPFPRIEDYAINDYICFVLADYEGGYSTNFKKKFYWKFDEEENEVCGTHRRMFIWIKDKGVLVFDRVYAMKEGHTASQHWQLADVPYIFNKERGIIYTNNGSSNVYVEGLLNDKSIFNVYKGNEKPMLGYSGINRNAPMFSIEKRLEGNMSTPFATLIIPFEDKIPTPKVTILEESLRAKYTIDWGDGTVDVIASNYFSWTSRANTNWVGEMEGLFSDGVLCVCRLCNGIIEKSYVHKGTKARII